MPDSLVAALIAAAATVSASLLQLKAALSKELSARAQGGSRRKNRLPVMVIVILLFASAGGGFAFAKWLQEGERAEQEELKHELEAQIAEIGRTATQLEITRSGIRADIETDFLRKLGEDGVPALTSVGGCKSQTLARVSTVTSANPPTGCTEAEATPIALCTTLPRKAKVMGVELFVRPANSTGDWSASRAEPGQEIESSRFSDRPFEAATSATSKHLCHMFVYWGSDRRAARMLVRYTIP